MVINIKAKTGEGKTKQLIEMCVNESLNNPQHKIIFVSRDADCYDWKPTIASMGISSFSNFRIIYAEDVASMMEILPIIDHPPYNVIALDGYILSGEQLRWLHNQADNGRGKIIYTSQLNEIF